MSVYWGVWIERGLRRKDSKSRHSHILVYSKKYDNQKKMQRFDTSFDPSSEDEHLNLSFTEGFQPTNLQKTNCISFNITCECDTVTVYSYQPASFLKGTFWKTMLLNVANTELVPGDICTIHTNEDSIIYMAKTSLLSHTLFLWGDSVNHFLFDEFMMLGGEGRGTSLFLTPNPLALWLTTNLHVCVCVCGDGGGILTKCLHVYRKETS